MKRPAIPAQTARAVLIESGHRCAVCGVPCPLERAHIVSWRKSHDHSLENLICLCANCHEMADRDRWGEKVLREYKAKPWVHRQNSNHNESSNLALVQIVIRKEMRDFDDYQVQLLRYALAKFLDTDPETIKVVAQKRGSVKLILECPPSVAAKLVDGFLTRREELQNSLPLFPIDDIEAVLSGEVPLTTIEGTRAEAALLEMVRKAMDELPPRLREFIYLDLVEGLKPEEIRSRLGITSQSYFRLKVESLKALQKGLQTTWSQRHEGE
jgi:type I restriction enzyme, R subunit